MKNNQIEQEIIPFERRDNNDINSVHENAIRVELFSAKGIKKIILDHFGHIPSKIVVIYNPNSTTMTPMENYYRALINDLLEDPCFFVFNDFHLPNPFNMQVFLTRITGLGKELARYENKKRNGDDVDYEIFSLKSKIDDSKYFLELLSDLDKDYIIIYLSGDDSPMIPESLIDSSLSQENIMALNLVEFASKSKEVDIINRCVEEALTILSMFASFDRLVLDSVINIVLGINSSNGVLKLLVQQGINEKITSVGDSYLFLDFGQIGSKQDGYGNMYRNKLFMSCLELRTKAYQVLFCDSSGRGIYSKLPECLMESIFVLTIGDFLNGTKLISDDLLDKALNTLRYIEGIARGEIIDELLKQKDAVRYLTRLAKRTPVNPLTSTWMQYGFKLAGKQLQVSDGS